MITLREHIDIIANSGTETLLTNYLNGLSVIKMIRLREEMQRVYPLKRAEVNYKELKFKTHKGVFNLVLGQFIMIEQIFTGKDEVPKHLFDFSVLRLILRPLGDVEFDNTDTEKERINDEAILDLDIELAMSILADFTDDRNRVLFKEFAGVFYDPDQEKEERPERVPDNDTFEYKFREQWYWYSIVRRLGGENILNYDKVYMIRMESVLPELSFLIQKAKLDKAREFRNRVARGL